MKYLVTIKLESSHHVISYETNDLSINDSLVHWLPFDDDVSSITIERTMEDQLDYDDIIQGHALELTREFPDGWDKNVKLIIDPTGSLEETKSVVLVGGDLNIYMIDIRRVEGHYYQLEYKDEMIGGLRQVGSKITGKIDISAINDDFGTCIVVHLSRLPSAMFLLKPQPKGKFDPRSANFLTMEEFSD